MSLRKDIEKMTKYEQRKLQVDFLRFIATMCAPFIMVGLTYLLKKLGLL